MTWDARDLVGTAAASALAVLAPRPPAVPPALPGLAMSLDDYLEDPLLDHLPPAQVADAAALGLVPDAAWPALRRLMTRGVSEL